MPSFRPLSSGPISNTARPFAVAGLTISSTGISTGGAFGAVTFTLGAVTLNSVSVLSQETFGAGTTLTVAAGGIAASSIVNGEAFGQAVLTVGPVSVPSDGILSLEQFGASTTLAIGAGAVVASSIPSQEAFGAVTVTLGSVTIAGQGIDSREAFGPGSDLFLGNIPVPQQIIIDPDGYNRKHREAADKIRAWEDDLKRIVERAFETVLGEPEVPAPEERKEIKRTIRREIKLQGAYESVQRIETLIRAYETQLAEEEEDELALVLLMAA
jgi:hypothetical protein